MIRWRRLNYSRILHDRTDWQSLRLMAPPVKMPAAFWLSLPRCPSFSVSLSVGTTTLDQSFVLRDLRSGICRPTTSYGDLTENGSGGIRTRIVLFKREA